MADPIATGGGIAGGIVSIAYATKLFVEARRESRATRNAPSAAVTDAAAANSLLLAALQEERTEVQRLSQEVEALRQANTRLYDDMRRQRTEYEQELQVLREQMGELTDRLEHLQSRIRDGLPNTDH
jgi:chromosome segregation ATPase